MSQVLEMAPGAKRALFSHFHIGGCQSCAYQLDETLAAVCEQHELLLPEVIAALQASHIHDLSMLISPRDLQEKLSEKPLILDIRSREEFESAPFPNAEFCSQERQQAAFSQCSAETEIYLIDHLGHDVLDRCSWFRGHGFKKTWGLQGGIDAWSQEVDSQTPRYKLELH